MLINQKAVKQFALDMAATHRQFHPFERVSSEFLDKIDAAVRRVIIAEIKALPSKGKTIK